jgi:2-keto-4-pentenoate hydratase/2-oxohepta-3-ene-1,7-dioic acid hydratase in catechol pathway
MKLARVAFGDGPAAAVDADQHWVRLRALGLPDAPDATGLLSDPGKLRAVAAAVDLDQALAAGDAVGMDQAALLAPLVRPGKLLAIGLNYRDHAAEAGMDLPRAPLLFGKFPSSLTGPTDDVTVTPAMTRKCDYEVELAAVIGRPARDVDAARALEHVGAYAVANDLSSRDVQFAEPQWIRSKSFDGFCPLGPWLTTADEVGDPQALAIGTWVNGEVRQDSSTAEMVFGVAELIAFLSQGITLETGDVILTGTPAGVALGMPEPRWLTPGDVVRCAIDGLGEISNRIV